SRLGPRREVGPIRGDAGAGAGALSLYAPAALGLSGLLGEGLRGLGASGVRVELSGVAFQGDLGLAYRACLWSRLASRVLLQLARFPAPDGDALYAGVARIDWASHLVQGGTLAVAATGTNQGLRHTGFAAMRVKDAIVDQLREASGSRPSVDLGNPDLRVSLHIAGSWATLGVDLSGEALHRRGFRVPGAEAPLKENVAAAMLVLLGWPAIARAGGPFVDPMCGGGTLPIEAALMAGDVASGLGRQRFGFERWGGHDSALWASIRAEAVARAEAGREQLPAIVGYDADRASVAAAGESIARAGLTGRVHVERRELGRASPPSGGVEPGLVAVNPPYGERLGERGRLRLLYSSLGGLLKERFLGYRVGVLTLDQELAACVGLPVKRSHPLKNGGLDCELHVMELGSAKKQKGALVPEGASAIVAATTTARAAKAAAAAATTTARAAKAAAAAALASASPGSAEDEAPLLAEPGEPAIPLAIPHRLTEGAEAFSGRLAKRARHLGRWAARQGIGCYRVYDADLPEYSVAVDRYEGFVHLQEYAPPKTVDPARAAARLADVLCLVPEVLGVPPERVFLKVRRRQRGPAQYQKLGESGSFVEVGEGGHRFWVNFTDYLDTGLFLDHRLVRARVGELAGGRRFLNLFGYTGTATVYAGRAGAQSTTTVDLSQTYLGWAGRNLALNGLTGRRHRLERADCLAFLAEAREEWDLVFLDPPTFSNSKALDRDLDVQKDHVALIEAVARRLAKGGVILFSCNYRRFKLDREALSRFEIVDLTTQTLPEDFKRSARIHQVYELRL
ncbi:MAG: bifunctional 23S rRNA (guanine(2069)-N(7))-methyltransferase RlmK/23S rRNA (guanine(2445)-N(2))-methyltransferase RlmL, partial [Polyangia bacterium]|nr:bifunctional 23S rRNA (guanine(2069)-N(7))-methyltransferase RlmK/23S rRNA (guanine(2445)-N(2))-methyltransferase RlmL [Polyangia bacterium]